MRAFGQVLLRLLQYIALLAIALLGATGVMVLMQVHTPDLTLLAALVTLAAAVLDFIRRQRS